MCSWSILFCLALILNNGIMETPKFVFDYTPLDHSRVLITWKSNTSLNEDYGERYLTFARRSSRFAHIGGIATFELEDGYYEKSETAISTGQEIIKELDENTLYKVIIQQYLNRPGTGSSKLETRFPLMIKTNRRTNTSTKPAKPDLRYEFSTTRYLSMDYLRIYWLPCGKEGNCHGNEAGTHFAVKFRPLDRRGDYRFEEDESDFIDFACLIGGIQYEVIIISINRDYETESDPQQIFVPPLISAVTSVKVVSHLNGSVSVSWKPPKYELQTLKRYLLGIISDSTVNDPVPLYEYGITDVEIAKSFNGFYEPVDVTEKLFDKQKFHLKPGDTYTFFILPIGKHFAGLETRVKYTIPRSDDEL